MQIRKSGNGFSVRLATDSWYGSRRFNQLYAERTLVLPKSWDVHIFEPDHAGEMRPLSADEIGAAVREHPIDTEPLRRLAESRKSAAIVIDDMSRPTPTYAVMPHILDELEAGGISPEATTIVVGIGTHRPITLTEQRRKLGRHIVDRVKVVNHNAFARRMKTYRRPDGGPDFQINGIVGDADLKISVSGILTHGGAAFGGGAKAILPSVASYDSIRYNHSTFDWEANGTVYPRQIQTRGLRRDMEVCAAAVGLDYSVNVVYSPTKEVLGIFGGDFISAHREGSRLGRHLFLTTAPAAKLDLVIANSHPMDSDLMQAKRGSWPEAYGARSVLIGGARDGWPYHGDGGKSYRVYREKRRNAQQLDAYRFRGAREIEGDEERVFYSPTLSPEQFYETQRDRRFFNRWDELVAELDGTGRQQTVGIFPCASMQIEHRPSA